MAGPIEENPLFLRPTILGTSHPEHDWLTGDDVGNGEGGCSRWAKKAPSYS